MSAEFGFDFYFGGLAVLILAASFLMFVQSRRMSYQCRSPKILMVFRDPLGLRLWMIMLVLWLIACVVLQIVNNIDTEDNLFFMLPLSCVLAAPFILLASRWGELRLDSERRTYRFTEKTLFRSRVHSGPWKDFAGVFVRIPRTRSGDCHVGLAWRNDRDSLPYLGYGNRIKAQAFAVEISEKLSLPIVPAPAPGKSPVLFG